MPIVIRVYEDAQSLRPVVVCDACGLLIENSDEANYAWFASPEDMVPGQDFEPAFYHKGCSPRRAPEGMVLLDIDLTFFLTCLGNSVGLRMGASLTSDQRQHVMFMGSL